MNVMLGKNSVFILELKKVTVSIILIGTVTFLSVFLIMQSYLAGGIFLLLN